MLPLAVHLTGSEWRVVSTPNRGSTGSLRRSFSVVAPGAVWAVGYSFNPYPMRLVLHWDGSLRTGVSPPGYTWGALHDV